MRVEDSAQLKKTTQDRARAAAEEARSVHAACIGERPGPVEREGERAAIRWDQRFCKLARRIVVVVVDAATTTIAWIRRWVQSGERRRQHCERPCALWSRIVLRRACIIGVGEEQREQR